MLRIIIMSIILAGTPGLLMAQSEFLDDHENAIGVCGSYSRGPWGTRIGELDLGFSIGGRFDVGFSYQAVFNNENSWFGSNKINEAKGAYIGYYPLKQNNSEIPISLAIGISGLVDKRNESASLSVSLMRYFSLSNNIRILPIVSISYIVDDYEENEALQIALPVSMRFGGDFILFAGPSFYISNNYSGGGISFGMEIKLH